MKPTLISSADQIKDANFNENKRQNQWRYLKLGESN